MRFPFLHLQKEKRGGLRETIPRVPSEVKCEVKVAQSCLTLCDSPWNSPGENTGMGNISLLQRIFKTQGLNPGVSLCRQILY